MMKSIEIQRPSDGLRSVASRTPVPRRPETGPTGSALGFGVDGFDPRRLDARSQKLLQVLDTPSNGILLREAGAAGLSAKLVGPSRRSSDVGHELSLSPPLAGPGASAELPGFAARLPRYRRIRALADRTLQDVMATGVERPHLQARLLKLSSMQDGMIAGLRRDLRQAGLRPDLVDGVSNAHLPAVAALLESWSIHGRQPEDPARPLSAVNGSDLHAIKALVAEGDDMVDRALASLPHLPQTYLLRSGDLAFFDQLSKQSFVRGEALREQFDFMPSLLEAPVLGRLTDDGFRELQSFLTDLRDQAGLQIVSGVQHRHGETSLESMVEYLGFEWGEGGSTGRDTEGADRARASFVQGARTLAERTGQAFRTDHWPLALALGGADRHLAQCMEGVLNWVSPFGHAEAPWVLLDVAQKLAQSEPDLQSQAFALLKKTSESLGRKRTGEEGRLEPHEAAAVIRAWALGKEVGSYEAHQIQDLAHPAGESLALKDIYTWTRLRRVERQMDREALVRHVAKRLVPGTSRSDDNAEYSDRFADHAHKLTTPELHKLRKLQDALRTPEFREQVRQMLALALFQPGSEWGGQVLMEHGKVSLKMLPPADLNSSDSYAFPLEHANPVDALAHFHLHATSERGDPRLAGPSSGYGGTVADLGVAYRFGQDGVVFSLVGPETVNVDFFTADGAVVNLGDHSVPPPDSGAARSPSGTATGESRRSRQASGTGG